MKLIVGLGNIGKEYEKTRHNIGFMFLEEIGKKWNIDFKEEKRFKGSLGISFVDKEKTLFLKPSTYMNLSGEAVMQAINFYKPDHDKIFVIYDDIDIPTSKVRVRPSGSAGTHNGMKSVIACLGTQNFPRVRIGTGPVPEHRELVEYVLSGIPKDIRPEVFASFETAVKATEELIGANEQKNK